MGIGMGMGMGNGRMGMEAKHIALKDYFIELAWGYERLLQRVWHIDMPSS